MGLDKKGNASEEGIGEEDSSGGGIKEKYVSF